MAGIAIAGNPNAGKTSIFNHLTGTLQSVANYPGVTVEIKEGVTRYNGRRIHVIDLPGTYSLTAYSQEELVARNFMIEEGPDLVVDVIDASNLERHLYLAIQIMEMGAPLILALNMVDVAKRRGLNVDHKKLAELLGVPVVPTVGNKGTGVKQLLQECVDAMDAKVSVSPRPVTYGHEVDDEVDKVADLLKSIPSIPSRYPPRWLAVKLLEQDPEVEKKIADFAGDKAEEVQEAVGKAIKAIERHSGDECTTVVAERRYGYAAGIMKECVTLTGEARQMATDRIDTVVCNRFIGPVILVAVVAALFFSVFKISTEWQWVPWIDGWYAPVEWVEWMFERLSMAIAGLEARVPVLHSLLDDALIAGVGGILGFVPLIFTMFFFISALEDTGYIARVAFILDRVLQTFGMQGKSILALIVSGGLGAGGCAVPGVMATRTLREEKDRLITMLVAPFMNCGAKLTVYAMLIAAFFPKNRTQVMLFLWAFSWIVALFAALVLRKFVIRGEQTPFVMELPPYHMPVLRSLLLHTWERTWLYIKKAGTMILAINIVLWALMYFPRPPEAADAPKASQPSRVTAETQAEEAAGALSHSFAGRFGRALEPVTQWAGFDWRTNIALIGGFMAKEVIVGTMGTALAMGDTDADQPESLSQRLARDPTWNRLKGFVLMVFVMIYAPCFMCMAVIWRESGSWKWALFSTAYSTALAFVVAVIIYQGGLALGLGIT
ncbi:MAG: ferrous iron transport protein B [Candidatus Hydrogenedentota bacterium]